MDPIVKQIGTALITQFVIRKAFGGKASALVSWGMAGLGLFYMMSAKQRAETSSIEVQHGIKTDLLVRVMQTVGEQFGNAEKTAKELKRLYAKYVDWEKAAAALYVGESALDAMIKNKGNAWQAALSTPARAFMSSVYW